MFSNLILYYFRKLNIAYYHPSVQFSSIIHRQTTYIYYLTLLKEIDKFL